MRGPRVTATAGMALGIAIVWWMVLDCVASILERLAAAGFMCLAVAFTLAFRLRFTGWVLGPIGARIQAMTRFWR